MTQLPSVEIAQHAHLRSVAAGPPLPLDPADELAQLPSDASRRLFAQLKLLARNPINLCLRGPSGTGKYGMGMAIRKMSSRADLPCVQLDLAALPGPLASSAILGHAKGAFTDAKSARRGALMMAHGGTLVLDEITKASLDAQHQLLRVYDRGAFTPLGTDREVVVDVRLIAMTSESLDDAVKRAKLLPDLRERLRSGEVRVLPLSERPEDIPAIVDIALQRHALSFGYEHVPRVDDGVLRALQSQPLPGNHRQVDGAVQWMLAVAAGAPVIRASHLPDRDDEAEGPRVSARTRYALDRAAGVPSAFARVGEAAEFYEVDRSTIRRWRREETKDH